MTETVHLDATSEQHHDPGYHLAHHFDTPKQQFDSGKLGVWLFLTTEILLFSGLFCAYSVYRALHPKIFMYAHLYLSKPEGALNTAILIFSSFTMALGVRAAQLGQTKLLMTMLPITILCGAAFLGIHGNEYYEKYHQGLLPGQWYNPAEAPPGVEMGAVISPGKVANAAIRHGQQPPAAAQEKMAVVAGEMNVATPIPSATPQSAVQAPTTQPHDLLIEQQQMVAGAMPGGLSAEWLRKQPAPEAAWSGPSPKNVHLFFAIYYLLTGLHSLHVIAGMCLIAWVWWRARKGVFGPKYFSPVDFVGLYWHLVDLIWIFLFPLLYLIK